MKGEDECLENVLFSSPIDLYGIIFLCDNYIHSMVCTIVKGLMGSGEA